MTYQDRYVLKDIDIGVEEILRQRKKGLNPGARIRIKDARPETPKEVETRINIKKIDRIKDNPKFYRFTGFLSRDTWIGGYFYPNECEVEGFIATDMSHVFGLPISFSAVGRQPEDHVKPNRLILPRDWSSNLRVSRSRFGSCVISFLGPDDIA